jgi:hypothetical protein
MFIFHSRLINTLFLIHGDGGSTGSFSVSFGTRLKIVGIPSASMDRTETAAGGWLIENIMDLQTRLQFR